MRSLCTALVPVLLALTLNVPAVHGEDGDEVVVGPNPENVPVPNPAGQTAVAGKPDKPVPPSPLFQALQQVQIKRQAATVLDALSTPAPADKPAASGEPTKNGEPEKNAETTRTVQRYITAVTVGDWNAVAGVLAQMPQERERDTIYDALLNQLRTSDTLLPIDVLKLAAQAPSAFNDQRLVALGQLLVSANTRVQGREALMAALAVGVGRLGGSDPQGRMTAAKLLLNAGLAEDALTFLPPRASVEQAGDLEGLLLRAQVLARLPQTAAHQDVAQEAWELTRQVLDKLDPAVPAQVAVRARTLQLRLSLKSRMPPAISEAWMQDLFAERPELGRLALAAVVQQVRPFQEQHDPNRRQEPLRAQMQLAEGLLQASGAQATIWRQSLDLMLMNWLSEARFTRQRGVRDQETDYVDPMAQMYGNPYYAQQQRYQQQDNNQPRPLSPGPLIACAPSATWLGQCDPALARAARLLLAEMIASSGKSEELPKLLALAESQPQHAVEVLGPAFDQWLQAQNQRQQGSQQRQQNMMYYRMQFGGMSYAGDNPVPLTRAKQNRELERLATFLRRAAALKSPIGPTQQAWAFAALHSPAEVYRREDLAAVLGEPETWTNEVLVTVVNAMRGRLAGVWRKPEVQQQAQTKRTDAQTVAEARRGYELARALLAKPATQANADWSLLSGLGALAFDQAEFDYGQKVPLEVYVANRDAAFAAYATATERYRATLSEAKRDPAAAITVEPWVVWFQSALGASDLAYLTRQQETDTNQLTRLAASLRALPASALEQHLAQFASSIEGNLSAVPAHLKVRYLRHAVEVLGDHVSGEPLRDKLRVYDDLLHELALTLRVEGSSSVGDQPFGVHLTLQHSDAVGREAGGFDKLLRNKVYTNQGRQVDFRDDVEKRIRESLSERFEVLSITYHKPDEEARSFGRDGWHEKPLAFLLLKAKDPAADRLPSVVVDLDFVDQNGAVVLPVASGVVVVDARPLGANASVPPATNLELSQVLDARELAGGKLTVEVHAHGKGLIGAIDQLVDLAVPGFALASVDDQGLTITGLETDPSTVQPLSERRALVTYHPDGSTGSFRFPVARTGIAVEKIVHQRYEDADLIDADDVVALGMSRATRWSWITGGVIGLLAIGALLGWRRLRRPAVAATPRYQRPARISPFTVRKFLGDLSADPTLGEAHHATLRNLIADIDRHYFTAGMTNTSALDLDEIVTQWLTTANRTETRTLA